MTIWQPDLSAHAGPRYIGIADALAADVENGRLAPGSRLPTHRDLAYRIGVTVGTVTRAYAEARRRGLIAGEVGRGTYVLGTAFDDPAQPIATSPDDTSVVNLSTNSPASGDQAVKLAETLAVLARRPDLGRLMYYEKNGGLPTHRAAGAKWIARAGLDVSADNLVVTNGAQHGLLVALSAVARPGESIAIEEFTYTGMRAMADFLGLRLVPVAMDEDGVVPEALDAVCRSGPVRAVYTTPTVQNPTNAILPVARRQAIADIAAANNIAIIEDDAYGFLDDHGLPPIASFAPEHSYFVTTLSKSVAPGLRVGYVAGPAGGVERLIAGARVTTWMATPLMAEIAAMWINDGTAEHYATWQRREALARQEVVRDVLGHLDYRSQPASLHVWLRLPDGWRADDVVVQAAARDVLVIGGNAFAVGRRDDPETIRITLGTPANRETLRQALVVIADILRQAPHPVLSVV